MKTTSIEKDNIKVVVSIKETIEGVTWHEPLMVAIETIKAHGYQSKYLDNLMEELWDIK